MNKRIICISLVFALSSTSGLWAKDYKLPYPPPEFFSELARTTIPPGQAGCCQKLRKILEESVMIPASLAVSLFKNGMILIGDARTAKEIEASHISGALLLPYDKLDFMKIKPLSIPIALY